MSMSMSMPTIETVSDRLDSLAKENRQLRLAVVGLGVVALICGGQLVIAKRGGGRVVEAEKVVIRDAAGRVRASLGVDPTGMPGLRLIDARGIEQVVLATPSEDFSVLTMSERGSPRLSLESSGGGGGLIRLLDRAETSAATLFVEPDSTIGLNLTNGKRGIAMGVQRDGGSAVITTAPDGEEASRLGSRAVRAQSFGLSTASRRSTSPRTGLRAN